MQEKLSVSLKQLSALKVGGTAAQVFYPENIQEYIELLKKYPEAIIVGGGTNLFFDDKSYPVIICTKNLNKSIENPDGSVDAESGVPLQKYFSFAAGVPATVGGGVLMNFGAFNLELKDFVSSVTVFDNNQVQIIPAEKIKFWYRGSSLKQEHKIIISVLFSKKYLDKKSEFLTQRQKNMPYEYPNIGSIFKNPPGESVGRLIEQVGLKGYKIGDAQFSSKHANIIVNLEAATAQDVNQLISLAKEKVQEKFNISLEQEVDFY